jgi:hypothetical protein
VSLTYNIPLEALLSLYCNDHPSLQVSDLHRGLYDYDFDTLLESIKNNGIVSPLTVVNGVLVDGHHRAIVIKELALPIVPITYSGYLDKTPVV